MILTNAVFAGIITYDLGFTATLGALACGNTVLALYVGALERDRQADRPQLRDAGAAHLRSDGADREGASARADWLAVKCEKGESDKWKRHQQQGEEAP